MTFRVGLILMTLGSISALVGSAWLSVEVHPAFSFLALTFAIASAGCVEMLPCAWEIE